MTIENPPFEDVFPIEHGDLPAGHVSLPEGRVVQPNSRKTINATCFHEAKAERLALQEQLQVEVDGMTDSAITDSRRGSWERSPFLNPLRS